MINNKKGFSLPLAMGIVILITLLSISILEYIIPFSRDIKGVENSAIAYYGANSGVEEGLYHIATRIPDREESSRNYSGRVSNSYMTISSGSVLPPFGEGNSEYDNDWNKISSGNPVQLSIGEGYVTSWGNVKIAFRVPDLDFDGTDVFSMSGGTMPIVNWQLSAGTNSINAGGDIILADSILDSDETFASLQTILMSGLQGTDLSGNNGSSEEIGNFYASNCLGTNQCTLKFSIVNKTETDDIVNSILIPYLEWKIDFDTNNVPLRYTKVEGGGRANGFKKELDIKVATQTVNEAFDFTVFQ